MLPSKKAETIYGLCLNAWKWEEPFSTANQRQSSTEQWLVTHSVVKRSDVWHLSVLLQMSLLSQD